MRIIEHPIQGREKPALTEQTAAARFYTGLGCGFVIAIPVWGALLWIATLLVKK